MWRGPASVWVRRALTEGEACVAPSLSVERGHGVADAVPDGPIPSPDPDWVNLRCSQSDVYGEDEEKA